MVKITQEFFKTCEIIQRLNNTNIVLIPKKIPIGNGELRPIALCMVLMKVITKVVAN